MHGERKIDRLIPLVKRHRDAKERAQTTFWEIYERLVAYRESPSESEKQAIESMFDELCQHKTGYPDLNEALLRKISGGTRSDTGRRCRDTFMSLKKTCRKLGVSFQSYLRDRIRGSGEIPPLSELMRSTAAADPSG